MKTKSYRTLHEPYWAKHCLKLDARLKFSIGHVDSTGETTDAGLRLEEMPANCGDVVVIGLLGQHTKIAIERRRSVLVRKCALLAMPHELRRRQLD